MAYEGYDWLDAARHRDLAGRGKAPWGRRALLAVLTAVIVLALVNVFGQRTTNSSAHGTAGSLVVTAPGALRAGDLFQGRFTLTAGPHALNHPTLLLSSGWFDGMTFNGSVPDATQQSDVGSRVSLQFDSLPAGRHATIWLSFQANPTTAGRRRIDAELVDGATPVATVRRTIRVFP
jgi:hypothetical protein